MSVVLRVPSLFIVEVWYRTNPRNLLGKRDDVDHTHELLVHAIYYSGKCFR